MEKPARNTINFFDYIQRTSAQQIESDLPARRVRSPVGGSDCKGQEDESGQAEVESPLARKVAPHRGYLPAVRAPRQGVVQRVEEEVVLAVRADDPAHARHVGHRGVVGRRVGGSQADDALAVGAGASDALGRGKRWDEMINARERKLKEARKIVDLFTSGSWICSFSSCSCFSCSCFSCSSRFRNYVVICGTTHDLKNLSKNKRFNHAHKIFVQLKTVNGKGSFKGPIGISRRSCAQSVSFSIQNNLLTY